MKRTTMKPTFDNNNHSLPALIGTMIDAFCHWTNGNYEQWTYENAVEEAAKYGYSKEEFDELQAATPKDQ